MRFQLLHPDLDIKEWSKIEVSTLDNLIKEKSLSCNEAMIRKSIESLESNNKLKVINPGRFRVEIENVAEIDPTITILREFLETFTDKK